MRKLTALLSMCLALSASATELWRWKDADGVTHYSDMPVQGAERIDVQNTQKSSGAINPGASVSAERPQAAAEPASAGYARCAVGSPKNDEVFNAVSVVSASIDVQPALQRGHRVQVFLNGSAYPDWPGEQLAYTLANLYRGSYTLSARVLDANGRVLCTGSTVNFYVRQPTVPAPHKPTPR